MPRTLFVLAVLAVLAVLVLSVTAVSGRAAEPVHFDVSSARNGDWSDPGTWTTGRVPRAGEFVQIRTGHAVTYDVVSQEPIRMIHVAGLLKFSRQKSTEFHVGLIKIQPGNTATEEGFDCDAHPSAAPPTAAGADAALEMGTLDEPIPAGVTAKVSLVYIAGTDAQTLPAIIDCGGRWDAHGAPMARTWLKLQETAHAKDQKLSLAEAPTGWNVGDRLIITSSEKPHGTTFGAEERILSRIEGHDVSVDVPLQASHSATADGRVEVANLSRNVIIESADPKGVRGHTMYHRGCTGGLSYVEFRHLGKEGILGKYPVHFHLVRDSMRGSAAVGLSIWDSKNRWMAIHGTDYLIVRDCVGYQSLGHGFFLEDASEQYNVLDRNLAVQAKAGKRLPHQALGFDDNEGAGFWWANGRNVLTRNVACENDRYGYRFQIEAIHDRSADVTVREPDGTLGRRDARTIPFLRFEDNESHSEGLYSFDFGDDPDRSVHGDRQHPFIARNLHAWQTHYGLRPSVSYFLVENLDITDGVYGVYHPDYDEHVYRNVHLNRVESEPINRGHDDDSVQSGSFTYDGLILENCRTGRDPLIQLTCTSPKTGQSGHFRGLVLRNNRPPRDVNVVDLGGGPRNPNPQNPVAYYFHDSPEASHVMKVVSTRFPEVISGGDFRSVEGFTGRDVRATAADAVSFPTLLDPVDDLAPATVITGVQRAGTRLTVRGISVDNDRVASVKVEGQPAKIVDQQAGVADWEISIEQPIGGQVHATAIDARGNIETTGPMILAPK